MKTANDPRHQRRRTLIKVLFSQSFQKITSEDPTEIRIIKNLGKIDDFIRKAAPEWPIEKINKIDLAILRLAVFEMKIVTKEPPKVIIDEAIELAKEYGSESSPAFINGTLGTLLKLP
ncbi:MAG: hypothetical protein BWY24_00360 [Microgenomates group bacterium ADurb.Bin219]|nr:MAG: hypothetical protein BWY24_00360 [Microgenomates group bacterium ADurb.Bin219]HNP89445.1 transcription antitermination factor NusB [Candidatus Woesebacteria bacterium]